MGKIISFIFGALLIIAGAFLVYGKIDISQNVVADIPTEDTPVNQTSNFDAPRTFAAQVMGEVNASTTSAGANKTPEFLLQLYPNLSVSDFQNVEANGGHYTLSDGEAIFIPNPKVSDKTPGAKEISDHGMETLLINIVSRTGKVVDSQENLTDLFRFLKDTYEIVELSDNIEVTTPALNGIVKSPLTITGKAKDFYQKEMFDVAIYDDKSNLLATSTAKATTKVNGSDFAPFTSTIIFNPKLAASGKIVLTPRVPETSAPGTPFEMEIRFR